MATTINTAVTGFSQSVAPVHPPVVRDFGAGAA